MLHALLIYSDPSAAPDYESPEGEAEFQQWMDYTQELAQSGVLKAGEALQPHQTATSVRVRNGETLTTDGPFAETKEAIGGYLVFEADSREAAIELAARVPAARLGGAVEVRPVVEW